MNDGDKDEALGLMGFIYIKKMELLNLLCNCFKWDEEGMARGR
jgi:hypothetical protein